MPLNASERTQIAESFLTCFQENAAIAGRALRFMSDFTVGTVNLLATVQTRAVTWQPFIDSGLSIDAWNLELARVYNSTQTG